MRRDETQQHPDDVVTVNQFLHARSNKGRTTVTGSHSRNGLWVEHMREAGEVISYCAGKPAHVDRVPP
jgi:hypothetical protein